MINFSEPSITDSERRAVREAMDEGYLAGGGGWTRRTEACLSDFLGGCPALLTPSCTAALEMAALLLDIAPGDEVIMPSFAFPSVATAIVLRGGVPVFVDIREDTLNIDPELISDAITGQTKSIWVVHYAGIACDMDPIMGIAQSSRLSVVEDAAQAIGSHYKGRPLGTIGDLGAVSFHATKNIAGGEGGALILNDTSFEPRARVIQDKGTDRHAFMCGEISKYQWVDIGSSYILGDLPAALIWAQLARYDEIKTKRLTLWKRYHESLAELEHAGHLSRPVVPEYSGNNAHIYYVLLPSSEEAERVRKRLAEESVPAFKHFVPLHGAPAGQRYGQTSGSLTITESVGDRLLRLPLHPGLTVDQVETVIEKLKGCWP